ncbi:MAG: sodium/solute symporter [Deltaproteobacteria bacterium]|nr:sodium/solute symporter [Deltaproteobacteria bacterium]
MAPLDWVVLGTYLSAMIGLAVWLSRGQESAEDYYVGGRNLPWWAVAISTMATQTSANSFIGIPAYVALKDGGGLTWLQYELAVPLAMIVVMVFLIPFFREMKLVSVYEYLELRFDRPTRLVMSALFLISRGLATGVGVYASAVVVNVCLGLPIWACIVLIGAVTVFYVTLGGMAAVVWSDVIQMVILLGGLIACIVYALGEEGGFAEALGTFDPERLRGLDPGHGIGDGSTAPMWGFLIGGLVLYISYYGVDQSQAQRELSAPTTADTKRSLVFNGLARFPLTILYVLMGIAVGAAYLRSPELQAAVPEDHLDYLVPVFVLQRLPPGLTGLIFAAILSAAMSSLDSALNSLSAATMRDFVEPYALAHPESPEAQQARLLRYGKITTVIWGIAMTFFAFFVGGISDTVVEGINKLGAFFYGPILAAFLTGILDRRSRGPAMIAGVAVGIGANVVLWLALDGVLYWMWWNLSGLVVATLVTFIASRFMAPPAPEKLEGTTLSLSDIPRREKKWIPTYLFLVGYFVVILLVAGYSRELLSFLM